MYFFFLESKQRWLKISCFFENLRIRANGYHYTPFHLRTLLPVVVRCTELSVRVSKGERMHWYRLFSYTVEEALHLFLSPPPPPGLDLYPFFKVFIRKLLSIAIWQLCCIFSCNLVQSHLLHQLADVFNSVLYWLKSCEVMNKFWEKFALHSIQTVHWHFLSSCNDVFNALQYVHWAPIILNSFAWPVQKWRFGGGNKL